MRSRNQLRLAALLGMFGALGVEMPTIKAAKRRYINCGACGNLTRNGVLCFKCETKAKEADDDEADTVLDIAAAAGKVC